MKKMKAFTLAEVLITLAIIGVVAALTVPTVITNYKNKALETQKKKAMSVLSNGFRLLMANDSVTTIRNTKLAACDIDMACVSNEIKRVFNVIADNTSPNDIFNTEYQFDWGLKPVWDDFGDVYTFITSDGMMFAVAPSEERVEVVADINGIKNPNRGGQDLCGFIIDNKGGIADHCADLQNAWEPPAPIVCSAENRLACNNSADCEAVGGTYDCERTPLGDECYCR